MAKKSHKPADLNRRAAAIVADATAADEGIHLYGDDKPTKHIVLTRRPPILRQLPSSGTPRPTTAE